MYKEITDINNISNKTVYDHRWIFKWIKGDKCIHDFCIEMTSSYEHGLIIFFIFDVFKKCLKFSEILYKLYFLIVYVTQLVTDFLNCHLECNIICLMIPFDLNVYRGDNQSRQIQQI